MWVMCDSLCDCVCVYACRSRYPQKPEEGVKSQELKLEMVVNYLRWVLGTQPGASENTASLQPISRCT